MFQKTLSIMFFISLITLKVNATTFQAMPLEKLIEESSSAAEVELKEKKSFMNKMGMILTEYTFTVGESYNVDNSDLDGEYLKITMTGGTVNGVTSFIDGAPDFAVGEKSFLLLKKIESKIYLSNFTLGKYTIQEENGKIFYVSSVFPNDADIGKVKKDRMIEMVKLKYKTTKVLEGDSYSPVAKENKEMRVLFKKSFNDEKREPAQVYPEGTPGGEGLIAMWTFFTIFLSAGLTIWWKLKKGVSA